MTKAKNEAGLLVRMPQEMLDQLHVASDDEDRSAAGLVRHLIKQYLDGRPDA